MENTHWLNVHECLRGHQLNLDETALQNKEV